MKFDRCVGIDYSGAGKPDQPTSGIRIYLASDQQPASQISPSPSDLAAKSSRSVNWSRQSAAKWLEQTTQHGDRLIIGIDHGLSFPAIYFSHHQLTHWIQLAQHFDRRWPALQVDTVESALAKEPLQGPAESATLLRVTETWIPGPSSVFRTQGQGSVGKSTLAGLPFLFDLKHSLGHDLHVWPFDGWDPQEARVVVAEVYPSLWRRRFRHPQPKADSHQKDAYAVASWLAHQNQQHSLTPWFHPQLSPKEFQTASLEGWILGVI